MNELITTSHNDSGEIIVSGRELHEFLEVRTAYKDWFPRMTEYGFEEGIDFSSFLSESTGGRPAQDHLLKLDMAKEISMLQRSDKGKQARQYFIHLEKMWNSPEMVMKRALEFANKQVDEMKQRLIESQPKVEAHDKFISGDNYQKVGQVAKVLGIGRNKLFAFLRREKIFMGDNTPYQSFLDREYFVVKEKPITMGEQVINKPQTYVTARGVDYIAKLLDKKGA
jgi:anti-repressor protein